MDCVLGFTGLNCELEVNDCEIQPCSNGGSCKDLGNMYMCQCSLGFTGMFNSLFCRLLVMSMWTCLFVMGLTSDRAIVDNSVVKLYLC